MVHRVLGATVDLQRVRRMPLVLGLTAVVGLWLLGGCSEGLAARSSPTAATTTQAATAPATSPTPSATSPSPVPFTSPTAAAVALTAQGVARLGWNREGARSAIEKLLGPPDRDTDLTGCGLPGVAWLGWGGLSIGFEGDRLFAWDVANHVAIPSGVATPPGVRLGDSLAAAAALPGAATPTDDDVMRYTSVVVPTTDATSRLIFVAEGADPAGAIVRIAAPNSVECR